LFDGSRKQAMEFYKSCFGGELKPGEGRRVSGEGLHAGGHARQSGQRAIKERHYRYFSVGLVDAKPDAGSRQHGLSLSGWRNKARTENFFDRLSEGADVTDPLKEQFHGLYGALNDKFGVRWMFQTSSKE